MATEDKLALIERVLQIEAYILTEDTLLEDVPQWDSLSILNLQIELTALCPALSFEQLYECKTAGDVCRTF